MPILLVYSNSSMVGQMVFTKSRGPICHNHIGSCLLLPQSRLGVGQKHRSFMFSSFILECSLFVEIKFHILRNTVTWLSCIEWPSVVWTEGAVSHCSYRPGGRASAAAFKGDHCVSCLVISITPGDHHLLPILTTTLRTKKWQLLFAEHWIFAQGSTKGWHICYLGFHTALEIECRVQIPVPQHTTAWPRESFLNCLCLLPHT